MKKKPTIQIYNNLGPEVDVPFSTFNGHNIDDLDAVRKITRTVQAKMTNVPVEYMINPSINYNSSASKMTGAIRIKYNKITSKTNTEYMNEYGRDDCEIPSGPVLDAALFALTEKNAKLVSLPKYFVSNPNKAPNNSSWIDTMEYISPSVPISCLPNLLMHIEETQNSFTGASFYNFIFGSGYYSNGLWQSDIKNVNFRKILSVELVLTLDLISNDLGRNGEFNKSISTYSFPVNIEYVANKFDQNTYKNAPEDVVVLDAQTFTNTGPLDIYATSAIIIKGNLNLGAGAGRVRLIAPRITEASASVSVDPAIEKVPSDVGFIGGDKCESNLTPVTLNINCADVNQYKSNSVVYKMYKIDTIEPEYKRIELKTLISLYPNPTSSTTTLRIESPISDKAMVRVYDMLGREVYSQEMLELDKGMTSLEISTQELQRGIYIVKVIHGELEQSLKLEVTK